MEFPAIQKHLAQRPFLALFGALFLCSIASTGFGQSVDIGAPSLVSTNEVEGTIAARDLGDSRLTDHFYAFKGTPGDVLITVKGKNLNGDVDAFTPGSLRLAAISPTSLHVC